MKVRRQYRGRGLTKSGNLSEFGKFAPGAADLKSLTHAPRNRVQGLQIESGTSKKAGLSRPLLVPC
jgi:hypothetical protein